MITRIRAAIAAVDRDASALALVAGDKRAGALTRGVARLAAGYAMAPVRVVMDLVPVLDVVEEVAAVALIRTASCLVPPRLLAEARAAAQSELPMAGRWREDVIFVFVWLAIAAIIAAVVVLMR